MLRMTLMLFRMTEEATGDDANWVPIVDTQLAHAVRDITL